MSREPLPERPRRYRFALTPLADAMFQLLIFFMLSASLTPYSLITLKSAPPGEEVPEEADGAPPGGGDGDGPTADPEAPTLWTVGRDIVLASGQTYRLDQLIDLAEAIGSQDAPANIVLLVRDDARMQDIATAMEALENAEITALQITKAGS